MTAHSPHLRRGLASVVLAGLFALAACGCTNNVSVRRAGGPDILSAWRASIAESGELSPRTQQTLHRLDLGQAFQQRPAEAYAQLQWLVVQDPQPDLLFALAECSYLLAQQAEKHGSADACVYYYFCAGYAYHYLFQNRGEAAPPRVATVQALEPTNGAAIRSSVYDPRFRLACDLYNTSLAHCIRAAQRIGRLDPRQELHLPGGEGFTLSVVHHGFPWRPEEFGPLLFCADFQVIGLENQYRGYGLGVALIGTRVHTARGDQAPGHAFYPDEVSFPVTAFFRFEGTVADLGAMRSGRLELYNPLEIRAVTVGDRNVPLEADLTTPLAYFLSRTDLEGVDLKGFLNPDKVRKRAGIYMFEPYQPGKIPVVMVHGLLSSPLTWAPMFNDLRADPELRKHFQFWFFLYPTANPFLESAADLRGAISQLRAEIDPDHRDLAFDRMVLVGHSMGGLVAKLLTVHSGDDFWRLAGSEPLDQLKLEPQTRAELQRLFYFEPMPCVRRVVFIATPHHGSSLSPALPGQLAVKLIHLPRDLLQTARDVARENPGFKSWLTKGNIPTSVDLLAPDAPALELLATRPRPAGVHYHSIIGDVCGTGPSGTDGVVPVRSAHLDGVDSEILVPAYHTEVHHHPRAVAEVWRILLQHLREG